MRAPPAEELVARHPVSCGLSAHRHSLLEPSCPRCGIQPSSQSAYRPRKRLDRIGIVTFRMRQTRPDWVPSVPRGRWCAPARPNSPGRHLSPHNDRPLFSHWNFPSAEVKVVLRHASVRLALSCPVGRTRRAGSGRSVVELRLSRCRYTRPLIRLSPSENPDAGGFRHRPRLTAGRCAGMWDRPRPGVGCLRRYGEKRRGRIILALPYRCLSAGGDFGDQAAKCDAVAIG